MSRLEEKLRDVLKREEPPAGFAERVLAGIVEVKQNSKTGIFAWRSLRWGLVGVACLGLIIAGIGYQQAQEERARSEAAKEQLLLALRIAGDQLQFVRSKVAQP
jgi:hypothetical protein